PLAPKIAAGPTLGEGTSDGDSYADPASRDAVFRTRRMTAERLEYRFLTHDQLIAQTTKQYHLTPEQLVIVDERRPHFWERLKTDTERFFVFFRATVLK